MGHIGECPVQEYGLKRKERRSVTIQHLPGKSNMFLLISNGQVNHVTFFIQGNTHSDQVPGAEEPVDLGRFYK